MMGTAGRGHMRGHAADMDKMMEKMSPERAAHKELAKRHPNFRLASNSKKNKAKRSKEDTKAEEAKEKRMKKAGKKVKEAYDPDESED